ncbi:hypothetical protein D3C87_1575300 [compost metagenome]
MAATCDHPQASGRQGLHTLDPGHLVAIILEGPKARLSPEKLVEGRRENNAKRGHAILDQRNIHGKFTCACEEFLGAIKRVDQPESAGRASQGVRGGVLFGHDGNGPVDCVQAIAQDPVGGQVCLRERSRAIGFFIQLTIDAGGCRVIDLQDRGPGGASAGEE